MPLNTSCISVLIIWNSQSGDTNISNILNYVNSLVRAYPPFNVHNSERTVEVDWADESTFDNNTVKSQGGSTLAKFNVVVYLHHFVDTTTKLTAAAQTALNTWVEAGGIFIGSSWLSYDAGSGSSTHDNLSNMPNLLLWAEFTTTNDGGAVNNWPTAGTHVARAKIDRKTGLTAAEDRYIRFTKSTSEFVDNYYYSTGTALKTGTGAPTALMTIKSTPNGGTASTEGTFLAYKTHGQGFVFGINDAFRLFWGTSYSLAQIWAITGLSGGPIPDALVKGIITEFNVSLLGEHCLSRICFLADTIVNTDQGKMKIQDIDPSVNTIDNKKILHITKTLSDEKELVLIKKNALGENQPDRDLVTTKRHRIFYKKNLCEAFDLVGVSKGVKTIPYKGEYLYNILMENWELIEVQNIPVETLHPDNIIAKLYKKNLTDPQKIQLVRKLNKCREDGDHKTYNLIKNNILS